MAMFHGFMFSFTGRSLGFNNCAWRRALRRRRDAQQQVMMWCRRTHKRLVHIAHCMHLRRLLLLLLVLATGISTIE